MCTVLRPVLVELELVVAAYRELSLASVDIAKLQAAGMTLPLDSLSKKMGKRQFPRLGVVPVLTWPLPVNPEGVYNPDDMPRVESIETHVRFVGGINLPKLITIRDSFGQVRIPVFFVDILVNSSRKLHVAQRHQSTQA